MYSSRSLRRAAACDRLASAVVCHLRRLLDAKVRVVASGAGDGERRGGGVADGEGVSGYALLRAAAQFAHGAADALGAGFVAGAASAWACAEQCLQAWVSHAALDTRATAGRDAVREVSSAVASCTGAKIDTSFARAVVARISELSDDRHS